VRGGGGARVISVVTGWLGSRQVYTRPSPVLDCCPMQEAQKAVSSQTKRTHRKQDACVKLYAKILNE